MGQPPPGLRQPPRVSLRSAYAHGRDLPALMTHRSRPDALFAVTAARPGPQLRYSRGSSGLICASLPRCMAVGLSGGTA